MNKKTATRDDKYGFWLGFDISTESGRLPMPKQIRFWEAHEYKKNNPEAPFHFHADAILATALVQLNPHLQNPFVSPLMNYGFTCEAWKTLEPHHELYNRAQPRIQSLRSQLKKNSTEASRFFESQWVEILHACKKPWGFDFSPLTELLDVFEELESKMNKTLLYDNTFQLTRDCHNQVHLLYSALFAMRSLIAMDHNAQVIDHCHEAARVDSITDYLPKAEYVANDALLYWSFKKIQNQMPKATAEKMQESFALFSHNGATLIESLPKDFLEKQNWEQLEESLYLVQMDWLLGTDSGLLFRLREEIFGLVEGYDKVFYPDLTWSKKHRGGHLSINVSLNDKGLSPEFEAA